ncbi:MFS transporter [Lysinimonas soli]|uniref:MFS transporter n=1 Tax=Lysinimonas soli TaxID=1074233 RepID=A0ABW0NPH3_9MICO
MSAARYLAASIPLRVASSGSSVVLPILAVQRLHDVAIGGGLVAASLAPSVIAAPLVGVALDRTRHPRRLVAASGLVTAAAFALSAFLGTVPLWAVVAALVISGAASPFFLGGLSSFVTDGFADERRAYAADALSYNVGGVAGPGLAAIVVSVGAAGAGAFILAGASLLGAIAVSGLPMAPRARPEHGALAAIGAGTLHLLTHRPLAAVTLSGTVAQFGAGALPICAVALELQRADTPERGAWIVTAFAIGSLLGSLIATGRPPRRWRTETVMLVGFAGTGLLTIVAALDLGLPWTIAAISLSGICTGPSTAAMLLLRKQQSPASVRSQIFTVGSGLRTTAAAVGAAVAGLLAGWDAGTLIIVIGVIWVASALIMLGYPRGADPVDDDADRGRSAVGRAS